MCGSNMFEVEKATYERERSRLVAKSSGKYVLISGEDIVGVFDTENDAVKYGYKMFGTKPFFVREIARFDRAVCFSTNVAAHQCQ